MTKMMLQESNKKKNPEESDFDKLMREMTTHMGGRSRTVSSISAKYELYVYLTKRNITDFHDPIYDEKKL